ncbi:hypothetical protein HDU93_000365 [Gonapodya sp. JEL0774]|nr:hypothetical protein HDU93_000365 [Gonapodya sp. JEL0774]
MDTHLNEVKLYSSAETLTTTGITKSRASDKLASGERCSVNQVYLTDMTTRSVDALPPLPSESALPQQPPFHFRDLSRLSTDSDPGESPVERTNPSDPAAESSFDLDSPASLAQAIFTAVDAADPDSLQRVLDTAPSQTQADEDTALVLLRYVRSVSTAMKSRKVLGEFVGRVWGDGNSALHLAAYYGMARLVRELIECGANVGKKNGMGYRAVDCAADDETRDALRVVSPEGPGTGIGGHEDYSSPKGSTALHLSAASANISAMRALVDGGADVGVRDSEGWTPMHCGAAEGWTDVVQLLAQVIGGAGGSATAEDVQQAEDAKEQWARWRAEVVWARTGDGETVGEVAETDECRSIWQGEPRDSIA